MKDESSIGVPNYLLVFGALMVLTAVTISVAYIDLGALNTIAAVLIAVIKAILVIVIFMHIKISSQLVRLFALSGFFWLAILLVLTFSDYLTRSWQYVPTSWGG